MSDIKISKGKKYRTVSGVDVVIKFTNGRGNLPVVGYIGDAIRVSSWTNAGVHGGSMTGSSIDLVEVGK